MLDPLVIPCLIAGFVLGILSGLAPGLHVNNFATMLLAVSPMLIDLGLSPYHIALMILAASISQTFLDSIPAVFIGAPDSDTVLAVLPGHSLMLEGRGIEAVRLSAIGSAGSIMIALALVVPLSYVFGRYNDLLTGYVGWLLLFIAGMMIWTEYGPQIEGQGRLAHLKYKTIAVLLFITSGLLGQFAFDHEEQLMSPAGMEPQVMLPLLTGIFGASSLILSIFTESSIPEQQDRGFEMSLRDLAGSIVVGGFAGSIVAWIPGVSPAVATVATRLGTPGTDREFLVSVASVSTSSSIFSLVALYVIGRPRSGAAAAIGDLVQIDQEMLFLMIISVVTVAAASFLVTIRMARATTSVLRRINYRRVCIAVLTGLALMTLAFTGPFGVLIFCLSTVVGLVAPVSGIRKTHAMGVLMMPLIIYYLVG